MDYKRKRSLAKYFSKLDIRVLLVFIILILLGLFIFMYQLYNHVDCSKVDFRIEAEKQQVGEAIEFKDITPEAKNWEWDFGDDSPKKYERNPFHKYTKAGIYTVTLEVNGNCKLHKIVEIRDMGKIIDPLKVPKIIAPTVATVGDPIEFYYNYRSETFSWEWSFGETGQLDNTSEFPVYVYSVPGLKKITLVVNGDVPYIATKEIMVIPRKLTKKMRDSLRSYEPEKAAVLFSLPKGDPQKDPLEEILRGIPSVPKPLPPKIDYLKPISQRVEDISEDQFELLLNDVAKQSKTKEDFSKYSCGKFDFPVVLNNYKIITFSEFCEKIKGKKIKIESLKLTKDDRNCIKGLTISYKVKKYFVWIRE